MVLKDVCVKWQELARASHYWTRANVPPPQIVTASVFFISSSQSFCRKIGLNRREGGYSPCRPTSWNNIWLSPLSPSPLEPSLSSSYEQLVNKINSKCTHLCPLLQYFPAPPKKSCAPSSDVRWANGLSITPHSTVTQRRHFVISVITFVAIFKVHLRTW